MQFAFDVAEVDGDYVHVVLGAHHGPLGTHDYRITVEATPVDSAHTFVHFVYSYAYGAAAALALAGYMDTVGAHKIGFTVIGTRDGSPVYVGDVRGALERNVMRYFLAVDACVTTASLPADRRFEQRLERWFDATERYAPQLHEIERSEYLTAKLKAFRNVHARQ